MSALYAQGLSFATRTSHARSHFWSPPHVLSVVELRAVERRPTSRTSHVSIAAAAIACALVGTGGLSRPAGRRRSKQTSLILMQAFAWPNQAQTSDRAPLVVIDGPNVAVTCATPFPRSLWKISAIGIKSAVDFFKSRGHPVLVVVPVHHLTDNFWQNKGLDLANLEILKELALDGHVMSTPSQDYDDSYAIAYAAKHGGCVVTNDLFRDFVRGRADLEEAKLAKTWVSSHLISYAFVGDEFVPNPDFHFPPSDWSETSLPSLRQGNRETEEVAWRVANAVMADGGRVPASQVGQILKESDPEIFKFMRPAGMLRKVCSDHPYILEYDDATEPHSVQALRRWSSDMHALRRSDPEKDQAQEDKGLPRSESEATAWGVARLVLAKGGRMHATQVGKCLKTSDPKAAKFLEKQRGQKFKKLCSEYSHILAYDESSHYVQALQSISSDSPSRSPGTKSTDKLASKSTSQDELESEEAAWRVAKLVMAVGGTMPATCVGMVAKVSDPKTAEFLKPKKSLSQMCSMHPTILEYDCMTEPHCVRALQMRPPGTDALRRLDRQTDEAEGTKRETSESEEAAWGVARLAKALGGRVPAGCVGLILRTSDPTVATFLKPRHMLKKVCSKHPHILEYDKTNPTVPVVALRSPPVHSHAQTHSTEIELDSAEPEDEGEEIPESVGSTNSSLQDKSEEPAEWSLKKFLKRHKEQRQLQQQQVCALEDEADDDSDGLQSDALRSSGCRVHSPQGESQDQLALPCTSEDELESPEHDRDGDDDIAQWMKRREEQQRLLQQQTCSPVDEAEDNSDELQNDTSRYSDSPVHSPQAESQDQLALTGTSEDELESPEFQAEGDDDIAQWMKRPERESAKRSAEGTSEDALECTAPDDDDDDDDDEEQIAERLTQTIMQGADAQSPLSSRSGASLKPGQPRRATSAEGERFAHDSGLHSAALWGSAL